MNNIWRGLFGLFCTLYVLLYVGYIVIIEILHSSYSVVSLTAIILPFLVLLTLQLAIWKTSEKNIRSVGKRRGNFIIIVGSVLPLYCGVILGVNEYKSIFTTEKWQNNQSSRVDMVDNLTKKYDFDEMTKGEVIELLGTSPETNYFEENNNIVYYLGASRSILPIDSEWLIFEFDDNLNVKKYEVRRY